MWSSSLASCNVCWSLPNRHELSPSVPPFLTLPALLPVTVPMKIVWFIVRKAPGITCLALLTAAVSGVCSGSLIALINSAVGPHPVVSGHLGLKFLVLVILTLASAISANIVISYLYRKFLLDLQMRLATKITQAQLRKLEDIGKSPLLAILTEDVDKISDVASELVPLITNLVTGLVCFGYLLWLSWQAFLGTTVFLLIGVVTYKLLIRREQKILTAGRDQIDHLYRYFHDLTDGIKELKLNQDRCQRFLNQELRPTARTVQMHLLMWDVVYAAISTWGRFLILVVVGLIVFLLPRYITLDPGVLTGYILALLYVRSALLSVIGSLPRLSEAAVALRKIESVGLDLAPDSPRSNQGLALPQSWRALSLVDVTHSYYHEREDEIFTLGPINLTFQPGELVFLVGGNGSGKTTLAKLITGLYPPETGSIDLDGMAIGDHNRTPYSQLFSAVFTDFHLFSQVSHHHSPQLDAQAQTYLARLHLDHKVSIQQGRLSTTALSRGQQQRLALLTAYLEDRPFYIFDEWAANQDPIFKAVFYTEFLPELKARGKAVLVISHDDGYFHIGDRILKLTDGRLSQNPVPLPR